MKILSGEINCLRAHTGTSSPKTTHSAFLLLSLTFRNSTLLFVLSFFHLPVGWFMFPESWTVKLWMDPITVTLSSEFKHKNSISSFTLSLLWSLLFLPTRSTFLSRPCARPLPSSSSSRWLLWSHFFLFTVPFLCCFTLNREEYPWDTHGQKDFEHVYD